MVELVSRAAVPRLLFAVLVMAIAVWLRGTLVMTTEVIDPLRADAGEYYRYAMNLQQCGVYSRSLESIASDCAVPALADKLRPPGYPLSILPFVEWPPTAGMLLRIQWFQVLLGALTVGLAYVALLPLGRLTAGMAAILLTLSPHLAAMNLYVLSETVFTFTLAACMLAVTCWSVRPVWWRAALVGATLGVATLVRPTTLHLIVVMVPLLAWLAPARRSYTALALLAGFLLCYGPWMVASAFHLPAVEGRSLALTTVHSGTYPDLMVEGRAATRGAPHFHDPSYAQRDSLPKVLAYLAERARADPLTYLRWYAYGKTATYLSWDMLDGAGDVFVYPVRMPGFALDRWLALAHWLMYPLHAPLMVLAVLGCVLAWLPARGVLERAPAAVRASRLFAAVVAYFILVHVVGTPLPRYAIPIRPLLYALACWSVVLPLGGCARAWAQSRH